MKKVVEIIIGNTRFAIEEDAFAPLSSYIEDVRKYFMDKQEDQEEIVKDIEVNLAEKFKTLAGKKNMPITYTQVQRVIHDLGTPAQMDDSQAGDSEDQNKGEEPRVKKLYRDVDNKIIAGVAQGMATYFGIDPIIVRLLFVIATLFSGVGIVIYIVAWILIPPASSTAQKLEMDGKPVNLEQISDYLKKKLKTTETKPNKENKTKNKGLEIFFALIGRVCELGKTVLFYLVGVSLIIVSATGILTLAIGTAVMPGIVYVTFQFLGSVGLWGVALLASFYLVLFACMWLLFISGVNLVAQKMVFSRHSFTLWLVVFVASLSVLSTLTALYSVEILNDPNIRSVHQSIDDIHAEYYTQRFWWHDHFLRHHTAYPAYK